MRATRVFAAALVAALGAPERAASGTAPSGAPGPERVEIADIKAVLVAIADRWVEGWLEREWDEARGVFRFTHGPYSDAFEHHYVGAVLAATPESRFREHELLVRRLVRDLVHHGGVFAEVCGEQGLRGYWALNSASDRGVPVGSGSWQSRSYIRASLLLEKHMSAEERRAWREGARWLIAALTVDWKETCGPWWSTNKAADHVAGAGQWLLASGDPEARAFLERQAAWFWRAFAEDGGADKYHNYFAKTMYRLAPILLVPGVSGYREEFLERARTWRSFVTPNGLYDQAAHPEPNSDEVWFSKLGPVLSVLLLAAPEHPELAVVARHLVKTRLAGHASDDFWRRRFDPYFGGHWGSLGLIIETAPLWEPVLARREVREARFAAARFFDSWRGLGRVAVKARRYQASSYLHWAWTWNFMTFGGLLFRLATPGDFQIEERRETGRAWLDWDPHADPESGRERGGLVVGRDRSGALALPAPPRFPDEAVATGSPGGRLLGITHCRYTTGGVLEVRASNVFLDDLVVVLNTITALAPASFAELYVEERLANPGDLLAVTAGGRTIDFEAANVKPPASVRHPAGGPVDLRSRGGSVALGLVPLARSFTREELVDLALFAPPRGDVERVPHRAEAWRGHLPPAVKKGDVLLADFAYLPHDTAVELKDLLPRLEVVRTAAGRAVVVRGEPDVVLGAPSVTAGGGELEAAGFELEGQLFAAEVSSRGVTKACLWGRALRRGGSTVLCASRPAAVTWLSGAGGGLVDAGVGWLEIETAEGTAAAFCANHDFPRLLGVPQPREPAPRPAARSLPDLEGAVRRFVSLPGRIEAAAHLAEVEMLLGSAAARLGRPARRERMARAREAIARGDLERAWSLAAELRREALALSEEAERGGRPALAVHGELPAASLLPAKVSGQERYEESYLISFAEEAARSAVMRRAERLARAGGGRAEGEELGASVRRAEEVLLTRFFGLPIRWTREHVAGQPDFFWVLSAGTGRDPEGDEDRRWREALERHLHATDRAWLVLRRIEAAAELLGERRF